MTRHAHSKKAHIALQISYSLQNIGLLMTACHLSAIFKLKSRRNTFKISTLAHFCIFGVTLGSQSEEPRPRIPGPEPAIIIRFSIIEIENMPSQICIEFNRSISISKPGGQLEVTSQRLGSYDLVYRKKSISIELL